MSLKATTLPCMHGVTSFWSVRDVLRSRNLPTGFCGRIQGDGEAFERLFDGVEVGAFRRLRNAVRQAHRPPFEMSDEREKLRMEMLHEAVRSQEEMEALDAIPGWTQPAPTPDETPTECQRVATQTQTTTLPMHPPKDRPPASTSTQMASMPKGNATQVVHSETAAVQVVRKHTSMFVQEAATKTGMSDFLASQNDIMFEEEDDEHESLEHGDRAWKETKKTVEREEDRDQQGMVRMELDSGKATDKSSKPRKDEVQNPNPTSSGIEEGNWPDARSLELQPQTQPPEATLTQPGTQHKRSIVPEFFNNIWSNVTSPFRSPKKKKKTLTPVGEEAKLPEQNAANEPVKEAAKEPVEGEQVEKMAAESTPEEELVTPADLQPAGDDEEVVKETPMEHLASLDDYPDVPLPDPLSVILDYHDLPEGGDLSLFQEQQDNVDVSSWMRMCGVQIES